MLLSETIICSTWEWSTERACRGIKTDIHTGCYVATFAPRLCARTYTYECVRVDVRGERTSVRGSREQRCQSPCRSTLFSFFSSSIRRGIAPSCFRVSVWSCGFGTPRSDVLPVMQLVKSDRRSILCLTSCLSREILKNRSTAWEKENRKFSLNAFTISEASRRQNRREPKLLAIRKWNFPYTYIP